MGQETSAPELPDHITARPEHLQSALYLIANQNEIFNRLLDTLAAQLEEKFANAFPDLADAGWTVEKYGDYPAKNVCILFKSPSGGLAVGIEGENRLFGKIYGFAYADKEDAHETELASVEAAWDRLPALSEPPFEAELLDIKNDDGDIVRRMMWRYLPDGLSDWDSGTWLRVADGSLAREIFKILRPLAAVVHP
ncbi:hypothetical protein [Kingella potus]|nr:hypothetical protein [Kingella potus]UOP00719.1 hypothetical protein LVJ84_13165 [Kingella potus]